MDFISHREGGFLSRFPPFSFTEYSNFTVEITLKRLREFEEMHKRMREFEEREISNS